MKKFAVIITTALAAFSFTLGTAAYAEENTATVYPQLASTLSLSSLTAYDISDDGSRFAFAQGEYIYVFDGSLVSSGKYSGTIESDGAELYYYAHSAAVTDIEFDGDDIVFTDGSSSYLLSGGAAQNSSYAFASTATVTNGNLIINIDSGTLYVYQSGSAYTPDAATYSCLKQCGSSLYVIRDGSLCTLTVNSVSDVTVQQLEFEYVDLTQGEKIYVGDTAQILLQTAGEYSVTVAAGTYVTNVDLSDLSGTYFKTGEKGTFALTEDAAMLYICTTGSVDVLSDGSNVYLTASGSARTALNTTGYTADYACLNTAAKVYSTAYMCDSTLIDALDASSVVKVNYLVENGLLQCNMAHVTYTNGSGAEVTGYIASNFITEYYFAAEDGDYTDAEYSDDYSEENVVVAVCLVLVIVVLVIAGVAFISYSTGAGRRKKKTPTDDQQ